MTRALVMVGVLLSIEGDHDSPDLCSYRPPPFFVHGASESPAYAKPIANLNWGIDSFLKDDVPCYLASSVRVYLVDLEGWNL